MTDPDIFLHALRILVQRVHEQGYGTDEVMQILADQGHGGEESLRVVIDDMFTEL